MAFPGGEDPARTLLETQGFRPNQISHRVTLDLRHYWAERKIPHPKPSFLSNVRKVNTLWKDVVFSVDTKNSDARKLHTLFPDVVFRVDPKDSWDVGAALTPSPRSPAPLLARLMPSQGYPSCRSRKARAKEEAKPSTRAALARTLGSAIDATPQKRCLTLPMGPKLFPLMTVM
jgi:hypothetical protein